MKIVFIAAECAPFVKVGGLADVVGALPQTLQNLGHQVIIILPHHGPVDDEKHGIIPVSTFEMEWQESVTTVQVAVTQLGNVSVYFLRGWPFFSRPETFIYSDDEGIDVGRFLFFCEAALQWIDRLIKANDFAPDLVHIHDWHTSIVPYLIRYRHFDNPTLSGASVLLTIHNMGYQGWGIGWHLEKANIAPVAHPFLNAVGKADNCLAIGLVYSTMLSTVSPQYALEIVEEGGAYGLESLIQARQSHLAGVLNGIDTLRWNPQTGRHIVEPYTTDTLEKRTANKLALQRKLGLPEREDVPLIATVIRLVDQKGPQILFPAIWNMLNHRDIQFVLLGSGFYSFENEAWLIGDRFKDKTSITLTFDEALSEMIYAAADIFVMPSLFEPCGIGQMLAMRYGAIPVVREVGGLVDTVPRETGFLFRDFHQSALEWSLGEAIHVYVTDPEGWQERQRRAMNIDFGWDRSAQQYIELYQRTLRVHRNYQSSSN